MKRVFTKEAVAGSVLARDVYGFGDILILKKGIVLTAENIYSLIMKNIDWIDIEEAGEEIQKSTQGTSGYQDRIKNTEEYKVFSKKYNTNLGELENGINRLIGKNADEKDVNAMMNQTMDIISGLDNGISVFDMLNGIKDYDDATFAHSINVSLICNILAKWIGMNEDEIHLATQCGLFHDVGKVAIPVEVLTKPGKLTKEEYDIVKTHTTRGYRILQDYDFLPEEVKLCALMHHERCDGSGYPLGLKTDKINRYAKLVAIADIYDAMTSARVYRGPLCPFKVIRIFEEEGFEKYDPRYVVTFLQNIADTYVQNEVLLSDGRKGQIILINKSMVSKPIVQCGGEVIDLSKKPDLYIENIL